MSFNNFQIESMHDETSVISSKSKIMNSLMPDNFYKLQVFLFQANLPCS